MAVLKTLNTFTVPTRLIPFYFPPRRSWYTRTCPDVWWTTDETNITVKNHGRTQTSIIGMGRFGKTSIIWSSEKILKHKTSPQNIIITINNYLSLLEFFLFYSELDYDVFANLFDLSIAIWVL